MPAPGRHSFLVEYITDYNVTSSYMYNLDATSLLFTHCDTILYDALGNVRGSALHTFTCKVLCVIQHQRCSTQLLVQYKLQTAESKTNSECLSD